MRLTWSSKDIIEQLKEAIGSAFITKNIKEILDKLENACQNDIDFEISRQRKYLEDQFDCMMKNKSMPTWCSHVVKKYEGWFCYADGSVSRVTDMWIECPICQKKRPSQ